MKKEGGRYERREGQVWRNDILENFFHCDVSVQRLCASVIAGVVIILQLFALLIASTKNMFQMCFLQLFLPFCLCWTPLLWLFWNFFHFGLAKKVLKFKVSSPMFFLFICTFCNFRWCHHNHLAIPNIIASFISDLF